MQGNSYGQYTRVSGTAAGTTLIATRTGMLLRMVSNGNKTGTVTFYDTNAAAGSAASNFIASLNNTSGTEPMATEIGTRFKTGLIAVVGGTTDVTVIWD